MSRFASTTYTRARAELASLCDQAASSREPVLIRRRNGDDVALISADELSSLLETAHLVRSPRNAARLLSALERARAREEAPSSLEELARFVGLEPDAATPGADPGLADEDDVGGE